MDLLDVKDRKAVMQAKAKEVVTVRVQGSSWK